MPPPIALTIKLTPHAATTPATIVKMRAIFIRVLRFLDRRFIRLRSTDSVCETDRLTPSISDIIESKISRATAIIMVTCQPPVNPNVTAPKMLSDVRFGTARRIAPNNVLSR
jgi:hypothetical protein